MIDRARESLSWNSIWAWIKAGRLAQDRGQGMWPINKRPLWSMETFTFPSRSFLTSFTIIPSAKRPPNSSGTDDRNGDAAVWFTDFIRYCECLNLFDHYPRIVLWNSVKSWIKSIPTCFFLVVVRDGESNIVRLLIRYAKCRCTFY